VGAVINVFGSILINGGTVSCFFSTQLDIAAHDMPHETPLRQHMLNQS